MEEIVNKLKNAIEIENKECTIVTSTLVSIEEVTQTLNVMKKILMPGVFFKKELIHIDNYLKEHLVELQMHLKSNLTKFLNNNNSLIEKNINAILNILPRLKKELIKDINAIYTGDPAAKSHEEVMVAYPSFEAIMIYRISHELTDLNLDLFARMLTGIAHRNTGIDIHPKATIGHSFCIDHGTGVVIGETAVIGNNVKLYQGVTIGALSVSKSQVDKKRHPTIEDNVTIYARTTILGGRTIIGKNSIIGGNVWLTKSIPRDSKIYNEDIKY
tara:strand:+ start:7908 stop:8723 length:816 start_codon:yes stop_codon:yes gene_type:complete